MPTHYLQLGSQIFNNPLSFTLLSRVVQCAPLYTGFRGGDKVTYKNLTRTSL